MEIHTTPSPEKGDVQMHEEELGAAGRPEGAAATSADLAPGAGIEAPPLDEYRVLASGDFPQGDDEVESIVGIGDFSQIPGGDPLGAFGDIGPSHSVPGGYLPLDGQQADGQGYVQGIPPPYNATIPASAG